MELLKKVAPIGLSFLGTRALTSRVATMIPGLSSLGTFANPVLAAAAVFGIGMLAKKVRPLAKHHDALMLGAGLNALEALASAVMPASVKSMIGMNDYIAVGDYVAVGGVPPINDSITLSDYIAVGGDGVEQELGIEEELGVEEELGSDGLLGGMTQGAMLAPVRRQSMLAPVPARSFTRQIPQFTSSYDNPGEVYAGIFNGGFGR